MFKQYIDLREEYVESPAFFLDVADYFFTLDPNTVKIGDGMMTNNTLIGVRILTNIAELEFDNEQLYR